MRRKREGRKGGSQPRGGGERRRARAGQGCRPEPVWSGLHAFRADNQGPSQTFEPNPAPCPSAQSARGGGDFFFSRFPELVAWNPGKA